MDDLGLATSPERLDDLRFRATIRDGWQQGKGAFGGLVLANLTRAMEEVNATADWPLRILNGEIVSPVLPGPAEISVEVMKKGSGVNTFAARLSQGGVLLARATALFGKARVTDRERTSLQRPAPPSWKEQDPLPMDVGFPAFARHFAFRPTAFPPFSGMDTPGAEGWICPRVASRGLGAPEIVAMADAWWPADFATETERRPMSTLAFTLELLAPLTGAPAVPHFHRATVPGSHGGFSLELRELWDETGRLVALNQQTFVYIR